MERQAIQETQLIKFQPKKAVCFISKGRVVNVPFDEIIHVSKWGNETVVYTTNSNYRTHISLQEILHDLPVNDFFRVHRSNIISLRMMTGINKNKIRVGEFRVPVSKYYRLLMIKRLGEMLEQKYSWFRQV